MKRILPAFVAILLLAVSGVAGLSPVLYSRAIRAEKRLAEMQSESCSCAKCKSDWASHADTVFKSQAGKCICGPECGCEACPNTVYTGRGHIECTCETAKAREIAKCRDNQ